MKGFIEHDVSKCHIGGHSNRGLVKDMCPVYLELRRTRLKHIMRERRAEEFFERLAR